MFAGDVTDRWVYRLRAELPTLGGEGIPEAAVGAEIRRLAKRASDSAGARTAGPERPRRRGLVASFREVGPPARTLDRRSSDRLHADLSGGVLRGARRRCLIEAAMKRLPCGSNSSRSTRCSSAMRGRSRRPPARRPACRRRRPLAGALRTNAARTPRRRAGGGGRSRPPGRDLRRGARDLRPRDRRHRRSCREGPLVQSREEIARSRAGEPPTGEGDGRLVRLDPLASPHRAGNRRPTACCRCGGGADRPSRRWTAT